MRILKYLIWILPFALPLYLIRFHLGPLPTTLLEVYLVILFIYFTLIRRLGGWQEGWKRLGSWRWPILAWTIIALISALVAPNVMAGLGLWRAYILEPILVLIILADVFRTAEDRERLTRSVFAVTFVLFIWALIQFLTGHGIPHPWDVAISAGRRATGPFPFPNALALFVTPIAGLAFVKWLGKRGWMNFFAWFFGLGCILLAKSDGGLIALLFVAFVALLLNRRTRWWAVASAILLTIVVALSPFRHLVWQTLTFKQWSGQVRLFQWRETWQMLKDHWFLGAGLGGYPTIFVAYHKATAIEIFQYPHNILFNFWTETGLLGVIVFLWIILKWISQSLKATSFVVISPLIAILVQGLVDVPYFKNDLAILFWMLLFLSVFSLETKKAHP